MCALEKKYSYLGVGKRLKDLRNLLNFSQENFAEKINVPFRTYQNYESGARLPPKSLLERIAGFCGIRLPELLGRNPEIAYSDEELGLIREFRSLSSEQRKAFKTILQSISKERV